MPAYKKITFSSRFSIQFIICQCKHTLLHSSLWSWLGGSCLVCILCIFFFFDIPTPWTKCKHTKSSSSSWLAYSFRPSIDCQKKSFHCRLKPANTEKQKDAVFVTLRPFCFSALKCPCLLSFFFDPVPFSAFRHTAHHFLYYCSYLHNLQAVWLAGESYSCFVTWTQVNRLRICERLKNEHQVWCTRLLPLLHCTFRTHNLSPLLSIDSQLCSLSIFWLPVIKFVGGLAVSSFISSRVQPTKASVHLISVDPRSVRLPIRLVKCIYTYYTYKTEHRACCNRGVVGAWKSPLCVPSSLFRHFLSWIGAIYGQKRPFFVRQYMVCGFFSSLHQTNGTKWCSRRCRADTIINPFKHPQTSVVHTFSCISKLNGTKQNYR